MKGARSITISILAIGLLAGSAVGVTAQQADLQVVTGVAERVPVPSTGCIDASADAATGGSLEVVGEPRRWRTYVPSTYDGTTPVPLVLWLHGQGMEAASIEDWTDLVPYADEQGFVVVAPEGHAPDSGWMWEPGVTDIPLTTDDRDIAFLDALLDSLGEGLCLDLARVYATGFSMGGHGVMALACALDERIAAVAPAAMYSDLGDSCTPERPVPVLALSQTGDEYVLWDGGLGDFLSDRLPWGTTKGEEPFFQRAAWSLSELERAEAMARRNGCGPHPESEPVADGVTRMTWPCPADGPVELVVVDGGEHGWLIESAPVSMSDLMWAFFRRFALPVQPAGDVTTATADLLSGVDVTTEEVERGVIAITSDGAGHSLRGVDTVEVTPAGAVWASTRRSLFRLGQAGSFTTDGGEFDPLVASGPDDDLMLVAGRDVRRLDVVTPAEANEADLGSERLAAQGPDLGRASWATAISGAPDGTVWASWSEGNAITSGDTRLVRFDGEAWEDRSGDDGLGALIDLTSDGNYICDIDDGRTGETWVGVCGAGGAGFGAGGLFRYDGSGWEDVPAFADVGRPDVLVSDVLEIAAGSDGTTWALVWPTLQEWADAAAAGDWGFIDEPVTDPLLGGPMLIRHQDGEWSAYRADRVAAGPLLGWDALSGAGDFMDVDDRGVLWVLAGDLDDGAKRLLAFDGATVREYPAVSNIRDLSVDSEGRVWLATRQGLRVLDPTTAKAAVRDVADAASTTPDLLPGVDLVTEEVEPGVYRVLSDGAGHELAGIEGAIVDDGGTAWTWTRGSVRELGGQTHRGSIVGDLALGPDGTLWAKGKDDCADVLPPISSFDGETWTTRSEGWEAPVPGPDPRWPPDYLPSLAVGPDGAAWAVGASCGHIAYVSLLRLGPEGWSIYSIGDGLPAWSCGPDCGELWSIETTPDGTVWLGMPEGGLLRFDGREWEAVRPLGGDDDRGVIALAANRDGVLWAEIKTDDPTGADLKEERHLARFDGREWEVFTYVPVGDAFGSTIEAVGANGEVWLTQAFSNQDLGGPLGDLDLRSVRWLAMPASFDGERWTRYPEVLADWASDPLNGFVAERAQWESYFGPSHIAVGPDGTAWVTVVASDRDGSRHGLYVITPEAVAE